MTSLMGGGCSATEGKLTLKHTGYATVGVPSGGSLLAGFTGDQMTHESFSFAPARLVAALDEGMAAAERAKALMQTAEPTDYLGRTVHVNGRELLNFACCSYMGLELRKELKQGAIAAIERYGTQFPFPRAMLQSPLYVELGEALEQLSGGNVVIAASTSLGH